LYGAGTQGKILEAMACATPVITTPLAVAPLSACPGRDLLVADRADDIAQAVLKLLADKKMQRDVAECGRSYVETNHNWTTITEELVDIYKSSLQLKGCCAGKPALQESVS
jgi:glycosyltransferase involved in cell wall biosynthesis